MLRYWTRAEDPEAGSPDWIAVAIFFLIACGWSFAGGRWGGVRLPGGASAPLIDASVVVGFGPVMGALVADLIRPAKRAGRVGFIGRSWLWALVALAAVPLCLGVSGLPLFNINPHVDGATFGLSMVIFCVGEELGWREWLHNALGGLPLWRAALITWALWFAWHWAFLWPSLIVPKAALIFGGVLLVGSFGLAAVARRTKGSAITAGWHTAAKALGSPAQIGMLLMLAVATWAAGQRTLRIGWRKATGPDILPHQGEGRAGGEQSRTPLLPPPLVALPPSSGEREL